MDNQFKAVPDGQYTQTIYTLVRDQKYQEVIIIYIKATILFCRSLTSCHMSYNSLLETEPLSPY
jgi:hypothetical protein